MSPQFSAEEKEQSSRFNLKHIEEMHPHQTLVYLGIVGIVIIFSFLLLAFWFSGNHEITPQQFPVGFVASTLVIIGSSFTVHQALGKAKNEELSSSTQWWQASLVLGTTFGLTQLAGWGELFALGVFLKSGVTSAYFYLLSGLHLLHIIGGIIFMSLQTIRMANTVKDPVKSLVFVTNPYEMMRLKLLAVYWHFMDALWLLIFSSFVLSIWIG